MEQARGKSHVGRPDDFRANPFRTLASWLHLSDFDRFTASSALLNSTVVRSRYSPAKELKSVD